MRFAWAWPEAAFDIKPEGRPRREERYTIGSLDIHSKWSVAKPGFRSYPFALLSRNSAAKNRYLSPSRPLAFA